MKRLAAGIPLVTLSFSLLVAGRADAQKYPQRMPYDIFDRSRPDRDHIAPPPPVIPSARVAPTTVRPATPGVSATPGVPTREFKLPSDRPRRPTAYESAPFDINSVLSQLAVNRGDLTPVRQAAGFTASSIRRGSDTFYVIPGCYLGNLPPREVWLPSGCDLKKARTIK